MTERLRAVFDTNVYVSAFLSRNPTSPTQELIQLWKSGEFGLLVSDALIDEIAEKLQHKGISDSRIAEFLALLGRLAHWIEVPPNAVDAVIPGDPDDDAILACAVIGKANYLVTYDPHFDVLGGSHRGISIVKALPFLWSLRAKADERDGALEDNQ
jgi:putative PIN family toxin of toxin-antitoxin system